MKIKTICIFLSTFLLVSCAESITSLPISKATSTMLPTLEVTPTSAYLLEPTLSPSTIVTIEASMTQAVQQRLIDCDGFPDADWQFPISTSNNLWRVEFCKDENTKLPYTKIIKKDGTITWIIPFHETYGITQKQANHPNSITNGRMVIVHWSPDGRYVYLKPDWCCIDIPGTSFYNAFALYRLDLFTGNLAEIIHPGYYSITFSPSAKYLVFSDGKIFHLLNLKDNKHEQIRLDVDYIGLGYFTWTKNEEQLFFVGALEGWEKNLSNPSPDNNGFSLLSLDLRKMFIKTLITNDRRLLAPPNQNEWRTENELVLVDTYANSYIYNIDSGNLSLLPK